MNLNRREALQLAAGIPLATLIPTVAAKTVTCPIQGALERAKVRLVYDFNLSLGDTIKEKFIMLNHMVLTLEHQVQCNIPPVWAKQGEWAYCRYPRFWMVAGPEVSAIFETATSGFKPISSEEYQKETEKSLQKVGYISEFSWYEEINFGIELYRSLKIDPKMVLTGYTFDGSRPQFSHEGDHYGMIEVKNWIW